MIESDDLFDNQISKSRYEAFSRLQAAAVAFGENLPIPEIVAVGGRSDGKSSLLEAFLGFRFNIREVEIGTRRPLIAQMIHDPTALQPRCRLQNEDDDEYGPPIVPETAIASAIQQRTEVHLAKLGNVSVSSKPIVMRTEFAFCPNLTIIDTPGLILKANTEEADSTPNDILEMVKAHALPSNRLILFLQQSSVEWASSLWMHIIQEVDPQLQRTVFVCSKFDNRLKEFQHKWEVDKYLSATGYLPSQLRPFFVALPKDRKVSTSEEWRRSIQDVDTSVFEYLRSKVNGGFDERRYGSRVGFGNLKQFLEEELANRYRDAAPSTLAILNERCSTVSHTLVQAESKLRSMQDVSLLRRNAMQYAAIVATNINCLLDGASDPDPENFGHTTEKERSLCGCVHPSVCEEISVPHYETRLYGGAAFERCMEEFQIAANSLHFPSGVYFCRDWLHVLCLVAQAKLANILLAHRSRSRFGGGFQAAEEIARATAREYLGPIMDNACKRLAFILHGLYKIAIERTPLCVGEVVEQMRPFVSFNATLLGAYNSFINSLELQARALARQHLASVTSEFAGMHVFSQDLGVVERPMSIDRRNSSLLEDESMLSESIGRGLKSPRPTDSPSSPRISQIGSIKAHNTSRSTNPLFDGRMTSPTHEEICSYAETLFQRIRQRIKLEYLSWSIHRR
eukprot:g5154.t1